MKLRNPFRKKKQPPKTIQIKRSYDAAKTNRHNENHWADATAEDANALITASLETLRNRARYEVRNNSYATGILATLATDVVGSGPNLQLMSSNKAINRKGEDNFKEFSADCDVAGQLTLPDMLWLVVHQLLESGEALFLKQYPAEGFRLQMLEPDYLTTPWGLYSDGKVSQGIKVNEYGRPVKYYISKAHPGSSTNYSLGQNHIEVDPDRVVHLFRTDRPGQLRGIPWITPALPLFAMLRRFTLAVISAAETAADISGVIQTNSTDLQVADVDTLDAVEMERNSFLTMPDGWGIKQFESEQPCSSYKEFKAEIIGEIARCINMPFNRAAANSAGYNYASGKLDNQTYWSFVRWVQNFLSIHILNPVLKERLREASLMGLFPAAGLVKVQALWHWQGPTHADPQKEGAGQKYRIENMTTTLADEYAAKGQDWEEKMEQLAREKEKMDELGLVKAAAPPPNEEPNNETQEDTGDEDTDEIESADAESDRTLVHS
ncbi:MAG: phage portal protein [Planctomycetota bacterium]|jgi:lambda family phage portal protein